MSEFGTECESAKSETGEWNGIRAGVKDGLPDGIKGFSWTFGKSEKGDFSEQDEMREMSEESNTHEGAPDERKFVGHVYMGNPAIAPYAAHEWIWVELSSAEDVARLPL